MTPPPPCDLFDPAARHDDPMNFRVMPDLARRIAIAIAADTDEK